eukprot:CAMPEP_0172892858 /NCGR_PEP_ID=MMETSP1075-20121228/147151_1 /TAXON_ID=2916 /ORGANISM="Ceratium fusus, Strain PA161109" /LENGTH=55 /DNA_ID=CAMNT_0013747607 /DNA_START=88 /DNA_END=252 /DNA_ORIENTATION=-
MSSSSLTSPSATGRGLGSTGRPSASNADSVIGQFSSPKHLLMAAAVADASRAPEW